MSIVAQTRSEFAKVTTTAAWWVLGLVLVGAVGLSSAGLAWVLSNATGGGIGSTSDAGAALPSTLYGLASSVGYVFPLLIGTLIVTVEFRTKTLAQTFLAHPRRGGVLTAKVAVAVVFGALFAVLALVAAIVPAAALLAAHGLETALGTASVWALIARSALALTLWAAIGAGLGALVRSQVAGVVIALAFPLFIEPLVRIGGSFVAWVGALAHYLPRAASEAVVGAPSLMGTTPTDPLPWWGGALVLAAYAAALLIAASLVSWRRDVD